MSLSNKNGSQNMNSASTPFFREFKKQASFFLKEKIKSARLALTDVTPIQLLTEEAVSGDRSATDTQTLGRISKAAFEVDDYWRIVDTLHSRLSCFEGKNWRESYNSLIVLEHLLTHGPESVAEEFQSNKEVIALTGNFQYIDDKGFNWGLTVRKKSERVLKLLEKGPLLKEERERARKLTRGIQGFGSFSGKTSAEGILRESYLLSYARSNSNFNPENQDHQFPEEQLKIAPDSNQDYLSSNGSSKENTEPQQDSSSTAEGQHTWIGTEPSKPLLKGQKLDAEEDGNHPFNNAEHQTTASLLS